MENATPHDPETGELPLSEKATDANARAFIAAQESRLGVHNAELNAALHAALLTMPVWITMDSTVAITTTVKRKYATLKAILEEVRPKLMAQGIRIRQGADRSWSNDEGGGMKGRLIPVYTDLIHSASGQLDRTIIEIPLSKMDAQGMGSAISYGRRYTLLAALGLATDEADDDGEAAKTKTMNEPHHDSQDLADMARDMHAIKDLTKLEDWARNAGKRFNLLSAEEQALMKTRKSEHVRKLMSEDAPAPKAKGKAAE